MDQSQLRALEARCIQEEMPFCTASCPIHVDARGLMALLTRGELREARKILDRTMPFPEILGRICDQPCHPFCKRGEIGDPLWIGPLERYCVSVTDTVLKPPKLPVKGGAVAVLGAGFSGMTAALDLSRKGRPATLITARTRLGGSLPDRAGSLLPPEVFDQAEATLKRYGAEIVTGASLDRQTVAALLDKYDVLYFDWDDFTIDHLPFIPGTPDPISLALERDGCFGGGGVEDGKPFSIMHQAENGRRAALSMERYLQGVSLTAEREKEGACPTRMYTVTEGIPPASEIVPDNPIAGYTAEEAQREAARCIYCECLECVKKCAYLQEYKEYPKTLVRKIYNNLSIVQGNRSANKLTNSCSLCWQCTVICPYDFPVASACHAARQEMVASGHMPPSAHSFALEEMHYTLGENCALIRHQPGTTASRYLFFPGCQLTGTYPDTVERTYTFLTQHLEDGVGLFLSCCGAPADWAGQSALFTDVLADLTAQIRQMGNPTLIVACSSCLAAFGKYAPELTVVSLWQMLDELPLPEVLFDLPESPLTVHDPCTARYQEGVRASVRSICGKIGLPVAETTIGAELADCCGYGGLLQFANQPLGEKVATLKVSRSTTETGLVYCAMCRENLVGTETHIAHLLDYLFADPEKNPLVRAKVGLSGRHEHRSRLKARLQSTLWQDPIGSPAPHRAIRLEADDETWALLNERLILMEDIQKVIHHAETTGRYLHNPANGRRLAAFKPAVVTYWAEYEPTGDGYFLHRGYSHRMQLPEDRA